MVEDTNNFGDVYDGIDIALDEGMALLHDLTLDTLESNWQNGQDALGNAWEPLAAETIRQKGNADILIESGDLLDDVLSSSYYDEDQTTSVIRTTSPYGAVHEFGFPERGIPRRSFLTPAAMFASDKISLLEAELDVQLTQAEID